jgi:hypothetical protein
MALPPRYRRDTGPPHDGGVLIETNHLSESRRMFNVGAFSTTERNGAAHALAPRLNVNGPTTKEGGAHALPPHVNPDRGVLRAHASFLTEGPHA